MDALNEKKWFVYLEDRHDGPFSLVEIQAKIKEGSVRKDQYVWAEGMQDWKPMADVPEFSFVFAPIVRGGSGIQGAGAESAPSLLTGEVNIAAVDNEGLPAL